ncbi:RlpA-like protein precursor [bacterium BMS3Abin01]|nr:RlpA-like protein precursor [bacterium BMS3Abin01]
MFPLKRTIFITAVTVLATASLLAAATAFAGEETTADIAVSISDQEISVGQARSDLAVLQLEIAAREQYLDQRRDDLADARMQLRDSEDRYNATLTLYEQRIAAIYKLGSNEFVEVALSSDSFADAGTRISYLANISANDIKLVKRVKYEEEQVRVLHDRVDELKQEQAVGVETLKQQQRYLEDQIRSGQQSIDRHREQLAQAEAREMEAVAMASSNNGSYTSLYDSLTSPSVLIAANEPPAGLEPSGVVFSGVSSWYGPGFHGNHTANGEVYDMFAYTAAHKTLPFNTWLKVTYNGRSVFVRINDRGPYIGNRFLDLSAAGARAIGLTGVGYVTAEVYR